MQKPLIPTLIVLFALIGTFSSFPQSFAQISSFGASECNVPGQEDNFNAGIESGERFWIIPNHEISLDPDAGPWMKNLFPVGGTGNVPVDDSTIQFTDQTFFEVIETITVGPNGGSFTDWHEEIVNQGWTWEFSDVTTQFETEVIEQVNGNVLTIFFNPPLPPGTEFTIEKSLIFVGPDGNLDSEPTDTSSFSDINPLIVLQHPTGNISCDPNGDLPVGGEIIPIELTSLILANTQSSAMWILPLLITLVGIGVLFFRKK